MGQSADQIRQEIDRNRENAANKIDQLQYQVQDSADTMRGNVEDTADHVRDQVTGAVEDTIESVKQNVDLQQAIQDRPLLSIGLGLVGGFILGGMTSGGGGTRHDSNQGYQAPLHQSSGGQFSAQPSSGSGSGSSLSDGVRSAFQKTGLEDTMSNAAAALIGSVTDQLKTTLDSAFPGFSTKMETAQEKQGDFSDKARETQSTTTKG